MANDKSVTTNGTKKPSTGRGGKHNFPNARLKLIEQDDEKREFMVKVMQNAVEFWKVGLNPVKSNDELCDRLAYFFEECARTKQLPTVEKMCLCIGWDRRMVFEWEAGNKIPLWGNGKTGDIIKKAKEILASIDAELATERKIDQTIYIFRSKNFYGLKDEVEHVITPNMQNERPAEELIAESKLLPTNKE